MQLYLIRHAAAADPHVDGSDAARPLTPRGRSSFRRAVDGLRALDVRFDLVLHSPLLRAVQTADLCAPLLAGETRVSTALAEPPGEALLALLDPALDSIALVGHEPYLSQLCAWLVTGWQVHDSPGRPGAFEMKKGAVAWLAGTPSPGAFALRGLWAPRVLKRLS